MQTTENQRIKIIRAELKMKQEDFAKEIGLEQGSLSDIERGKNSVSKQVLNLLEMKFGVNPEWIKTGEGEKYSRAISMMPETKKTNGNITYIPARAQAGYLDSFADQSFMEELPKFHLPGFDDCSVAITVEGDSMFPSYSNGDLILCKNVGSLDHIRFGEPYLILLNDGAVVKYILDHKNKTQFILISENELYKPYTVEKDRIKKIWLVKGKISKSVGRRNHALDKKLRELEEKVYQLLAEKKK